MSITCKRAVSPVGVAVPVMPVVAGVPPAWLLFTGKESQGAIFPFRQWDGVGDSFVVSTNDAVLHK